METKNNFEKFSKNNLQKNKNLRKNFEKFIKCHKKCKSYKIINYINDVEKYENIFEKCEDTCIRELLKKL